MPSVLRGLLLATVVLGLTAAAAEAQGNGPGFHVSATGGLDCPGGQSLSLPTPPASLGPLVIPCTSGVGVAAAEADFYVLRAFGLAEHTCCGTASDGSGSARIQFDNVVITGPPAASVPVSLNFWLRGTLTGHPSSGQYGLSLFIRLGALSSFSRIEANEFGIYNQSELFAPLTVGFPADVIDQAFVTPVANVQPNQPLRFDLQLGAATAMAGNGFTKADFYSGTNGFFLPFGVPVFNLPPGYTISIPELNIIDNFVALPAVFSGDIFIVGTNVSGISLPSASQVTGNVTVRNNTVGTGIDLSELDTVGGSIEIDGNALGTGIDLSELDTVGGSIDIEDNGKCTAVTLGTLATVAGDLTIDTCGSGTFTPGPASAGGNTRLTTRGYTIVNGTTATGSTTVTAGTGDAFMTVALPAGSFTTPVSFTITELDPGALLPQDGIGPAGGPATIDPIAAYQVTFGVPTLNQNATLTFDVILAGLDTATADALLAALAGGTATLATVGDAPGSQYQAFPICTGQQPTAGGCVLVQLLDANGQPAAGLPAIIRFSNVVGHFSIWAVAIVTPHPQGSNVFNGLLPPYPAPPHTTTPTFKRGSVVPLKFTWVTAVGALVDSAAAAPVVTVFQASCTTQASTTDPITPEDAGGSGGLHYDASARTWIFNWTTKPLVAGCYSVRVTTANPQFGAPAQLFPLALRDR